MVELPTLVNIFYVCILFTISAINTDTVVKRCKKW